jgi:hypothetical protein
MHIVRSFLVMFALAAAVSAAAQTKLPPGTPEPIARDMEVLDNYRLEVEKRIGTARPEAPASADLAREDDDLPERDPFEVSPQLRESNARAPRVGPREGMTLSQILRLRAVVRGPDGGIAKIESGKDTLVVHDGDELDVNDIRYTVKIEADGVRLHGSGAPQYKLLVR